MQNLFPCYTELEPPDDLSVEDQLEMYYQINVIREFDTKVRELWMDKHIYGLAHSYVGAEAIAVGACKALKPDDWISSTHRGHGHVIAKGGDLKKMMAELHGKYEGYNRGKGGSMHIADIDHGMLGATGIVGSGMPLAVGAAYAFDLRGDDKVAVCFHGDGGTHQGIWHESVNMAAAWLLPVIFLTENNQLAIATSLDCVAGECNIHLRAAAYCIPGVIVDGFNPFEVYKAVKTAAERARKGEGPTIIEAKLEIKHVSYVSTTFGEINKTNNPSLNNIHKFEFSTRTRFRSCSLTIALHMLFQSLRNLRGWKVRTS